MLRSVLIKVCEKKMKIFWKCEKIPPRGNFLFLETRVHAVRAALLATSTVGWDNFKTFVCMLLLRRRLLQFLPHLKIASSRHPIVIVDTTFRVKEKNSQFLLNSRLPQPRAYICVRPSCGALESPEPPSTSSTAERWHERAAKKRRKKKNLWCRYKRSFRRQRKLVLQECSFNGEHNNEQRRGRS